MVQLREHPLALIRRVTAHSRPGAGKEVLQEARQGEQIPLLELELNQSDCVDGRDKVADGDENHESAIVMSHQRTEHKRPRHVNSRSGSGEDAQVRELPTHPHSAIDRDDVSCLCFSRAQPIQTSRASPAKRVRTEYMCVVLQAKMHPARGRSATAMASRHLVAGIRGAFRGGIAGRTATSRSRELRTEPRWR